MNSIPLDIVIPVYDEGANIWATLEQLQAKVKTPHRVWIVYDFDEDDTLSALQGHSFANLNLVKNRHGRGVVSALKTGFEVSPGPAVLVAMADLSDDLGSVDPMFQKIEEGYDLVCGSRYMSGGAQVGGPALKKILSRAAGWSLRFLGGLATHDATNNFKMYRKSLLDSLTVESQGGFELGLEMVVKAHLRAARIGEVPTVWRDRAQGVSKFKLFKWLPSYFRWYLLAFRGKPNSDCWRSNEAPPA